ncbi:uncharacterized protein BKCO1_4900038 [Diplodia corticola]|uniref:MARVEL domain-containing protein n=1 Tax=Diplodia corticola TaxID=236234 RepID=A0A1J9QTP1_9PEZI|nr:uncharacterized protein BKCO1_4900038 [Diplodia corticola]OJD31354.1 hypothetical protein BKCO1_4900038 [Diplodia corticola]
MLTALKLAREAPTIYTNHKTHQAHKHTHRPHQHHHNAPTPISPTGGFSNHINNKNNNRATMLTLNQLSTYSHHGGLPGLLARVLLRFLQFVLALTVCGLYGVDLDAARQAHAYADSKWVYAEVVAGLAALTTLAYLLPMVKSLFFFAWDWVLFVLWVALFGVFGRMYIGEEVEYDGGVRRMKHAVWVDLACMVLWFVTAVYGTVMWWINRGGVRVLGKSEV